MSGTVNEQADEFALSVHLDFDHRLVFSKVQRMLEGTKHRERINAASWRDWAQWMVGGQNCSLEQEVNEPG